MTPTPEQIAAMEARGWTRTDGGFIANSGQFAHGNFIVSLRVFWAPTSGWRGPGWLALYGTIGHGFDRMERHPDPITAADEAESWLRGVLAGFRFPWLEVKP